MFQYTTTLAAQTTFKLSPKSNHSANATTAISTPIVAIVVQLICCCQ
jgi:hypothetical protein